MASVNRRSFLATSAAAGAALSAQAYAGAADRPNERITLAVMGVHGRGRQLLATFSALPNVQIKYICEVDSAVVPRALKSLNARHKQRPRVEADIRRVLQDKELTGLVCAAPDHWHALATVWACQHGKHVYVEKPVSHNVVEGRRMVEAARRHNCVVQVGTQRRSASHYRSAVELLRSGRLGKIPFVKTWIAGHRGSIGRAGKAGGTIPKTVNYDLWCGPGPLQRPMRRRTLHYDWHWFWDYGTGEIGNNGIHALDVVRGLLNVNDPVKISAGGGMNFYEDDRQTPDTHIATFDFEHTTVVWEHRFWSRTGCEGHPWGVIVYGQNGTMIFSNHGWNIIDPAEGIQGSDKADRGMDRAHAQNFLDCIGNNRRPNADIEEGHLSTRLCHLGNIAYRTGHTLQFDPKNENFRGDQEANRLLSRTYRKPFVLPARA